MPLQWRGPRTAAIAAKFSSSRRASTGRRKMSRAPTTWLHVSIACVRWRCRRQAPMCEPCRRTGLPSDPSVHDIHAVNSGAVTMAGIAKAHALPIRLLPRKGQQLGLIAFFGFFFGFSLFWMAGASGILDLNEGTVQIPPPGGWEASAFGLFGLPFTIIGICGMVGALLRMLPNSPYYHLEINAEG